jgi:hypothetical protein
LKILIGEILVVDDVDTLLRVYHQAITNGDLEVGQRSKIDALLERHNSGKSGKRTNGEQSPSPAKKAKSSAAPEAAAATNGHA